MKGERLHDVVGRSYDIEVRVYQNNRANADRARRIAAGKTAEAEKAAKEAAGTKRALDEDAEDSAEAIFAAQKYRKRQNSRHSSRPRSDTTNSATAANEASYSAGSFMHPPDRKLVTLHTPALLNASAWPTSAGVSSHDGVLGLSQSGPFGSDFIKAQEDKARWHRPRPACGACCNATQGDYAESSHQSTYGGADHEGASQVLRLSW